MSGTAQTHSAYTILSPDSTVDGKTIAQWTADWWTWYWQHPASSDPTTDPDGRFANVNNMGSMFFIAGTPGGSAERSFSVPAGKPLLIPMVNFSDTLDPKVTENKLNTDFMKSITNLFAEIDGNAVSHP